MPNYSRPATLGALAQRPSLFGVCSHATNLPPRPLLLPFLALPASAATTTLDVTVAAGKHDRAGTPVCQTVTLPAAFADVKVVTLKDDKDEPVAVAQLTEPALLDDAPEAAAKGEVRRELHFILPPLKAGKSLKLKAVLDSEKPEAVRRGRVPLEGHAWRIHANSPSVTCRCCVTLQAVRRLDAGKAIRDVQGLSSTLGPGRQAPGDQRRGRPQGALPAPPRHFLRLPRSHLRRRQEDRHLALHQGASSERRKFLATEAGPVLGRQRVLIGWHGEDKELFAHEERELTVYNTPGGRLVEFASRLRPVKGTVHLDGDPQHAGFHFRAAIDVADEDGQGTNHLHPARRRRQAGRDAQLGTQDEGRARQSAVGRHELRPRRPALHGRLPRPAGEPQGGPLQRTRLRPLRLLFRGRRHGEEARRGRLPPLAAETAR